LDAQVTKFFVYRPKTLAGILNFYLGEGLVLMTLVLSVAGYYFISHILQNALEQKAQALAEQVATTTIDAILLKEYGVIERMVNDLVIQTPDLHSIKIENQYQQVLADVEQTPANRIQKSSQSGLTIVKPLYFLSIHIL
jgi:hypothetical protein